VDLQGNVLGEHKGIIYYTVGQRRGLGIASSTPYYVVALDHSSNSVCVGRVGDLDRSECTVENVNWVSIEPPSGTISCHVRIRHRHRAAAASIVLMDEENEVMVHFETPQRAVTPGQAAVFYDGDLVLGGGTIARRIGNPV
jgi:tRNA-specific 2-thiouridylase